MGCPPCLSPKGDRRHGIEVDMDSSCLLLYSEICHIFNIQVFPVSFRESNLRANFKRLDNCTGTLQLLPRKLSNSQRQKWVSLVKLQPVIEKLRVIREADDDLGRTYANAQTQIRIFAKSVSTDAKAEAALSPPRLQEPMRVKEKLLCKMLLHPSCS